MIFVEKCENYREISKVRGKNCFNCMARNGYPYRAQPDKKCENFKIEELIQKAKDKGK